MKSFKAITLTLTCLLFAGITAVSSTQAAIIGRSIKNNNIKENHRHLKKKCRDKKGKLKVKGMVDEFNCKKLARMGLCNKKYKKGKKGRKTRIFDKCPKSCNIDTDGKFKVKGIRKFKKKTTCENIMRKNGCNKKQKNGQRLFELCPISCEIFCEEANVPSQVPTESPTASIIPFSIAPSYSVLPSGSYYPSTVPLSESPGSESPGSESPGSESPGSESPGSENPYGEESCSIRHVGILSSLDNGFGKENCSFETKMMSHYSVNDRTPVLTHITSCSVCPTPGYYTTKMMYFAIIESGDPNDDPCPYQIEYYSTYPHRSFMSWGYFYEGGEGDWNLLYLKDVKRKIMDPPIPSPQMPSQTLTPSFRCFE